MKNFLKCEDATAAAEAKSNFLANMSHEIRTPINAVLGMNEMILREEQDEEIRGYAQNIQSAGTALLSLVNDILDISKIESGKMEVVPERYELNSMLYDVLLVIQPRRSVKRTVTNIFYRFRHVQFFQLCTVRKAVAADRDQILGQRDFLQLGAV